MTEQRQILDISWESILKVALAGLLFYFLYLVRDIVIWFFFGLIISVLLDPAIRLLRRMRLPRVLAVIIVYLAIFGILGGFIYLSAPIFIEEIGQFSRSLPSYLERISPMLEGLKIEALQNIESFIRALSSGLEKFSGSIFSAIAAFFGGIVSTFFILSVAFFLSLEENGMRKFLTLIAPKEHEEFVIALFERCEEKVSGWFGARILACFFVGLSSFLILYAFQLKYAFILSLLAGFLNFIPFLGPVITVIMLALFVGISATWLKAMIVIIAFLIIQQIENNIISPVLMKKFLGLPPVSVLLSLVVGGILFGFLGTIFAIPVFGILYEFIKEYLENRKEANGMVP